MCANKALHSLYFFIGLKKHECIICPKVHYLTDDCQLPVMALNAIVHVNRRFLLKERICGNRRQHVHHEIINAPMS